MWPVVVIPVVLLALWLALSYNRFASQRASIASTWAGIDVQLQRRHDLVPNLVETVRAYASVFGYDPTAYFELTGLAARRPPSVTG